MRYKTRDIGVDGMEVRVGITEAWLKAECPGLEVKPAPAGISLTGRIERAGDDYLLRGELRGTVVTPCSRCLEPATLLLEAPVTVSYVEEIELTQAGGEDDEGKDDVVRFHGGVIDLGPQLRDELLLALPMGPLCREDCAGICPTCGGNRNLTPCDCSQRPGGAKLSALAKIKV